MADDIVLSAGTADGARLWTDEIPVTLDHAQMVKLADGTANSVTVIESGGGLEVNALRVTLASDSTGLVSVDDGGGALTVDGTVDLGATDNAVLDAIAASVAGTLTVDGSGATQPISGTVTANLSVTDNAVLDAQAASLVDIETNTDFGATTGGGTEAGALRVTVANDSTGVLTVDGTVTANLSATDNAVLDSIDTAVNGTLTVGAHAVTNAGTFVVQEDGAALTALQLIDDPVFADDAAFTLASSKVTMAGAIRDDSLTTLTAIEGDAVPFRVSATGALHVTGGGGGTEYTEDVASANPIVGTATLMERDDAITTVTPVEGDWIGLRGSAEGALWVQDFNSDAMAASLAGTLTVDGSGSTQPVSGTVTANLSATDNAVLDSIVTNQSARATGGHSFYLNQDTSAVASVKAGAGTIYWIYCVSTDATPVYLNLYNVASGSVTLGTTTPGLQFIVPSQGDANGAGFTINFGPNGIQFDTAITVAAATTFDGLTDPGTNVVITNIGYE